jgi:diamine N-acetyltransferase
MNDEVTLTDVDIANWDKCADLQVCHTQTALICSNERALAEAGVLPNATPIAINLGPIVIGLAVVIQDSSSVEVHRFMIACAYQGKGYGRQSLKAILDRISQSADVRDITIKFLHWNAVAERLYRSVGFVDTYEMDGDEKVFKLARSLDTA